MTTAVAFVAAVVAMEFVSYAAHRWLMHGPGIGWHRSHHAPPRGRLERNDLFPLCFSVVGVALFVAASAIGGPVVWAVAAGVTTYGALYLVVHEVHIHRRLAVRLPRSPYLDALRDAHRDHHRTGGEPYGMLLPLRRGADPVASAVDDVDLLDRSSTRSSRARL